jgi:hypothetical protein
MTPLVRYYAAQDPMLKTAPALIAGAGTANPVGFSSGWAWGAVSRK